MGAVCVCRVYSNVFCSHSSFDSLNLYSMTIDFFQHTDALTCFIWTFLSVFFRERWLLGNGLQSRMDEDIERSEGNDSLSRNMEDVVLSGSHISQKEKGEGVEMGIGLRTSLLRLSRVLYWTFRSNPLEVRVAHAIQSEINLLLVRSNPAPPFNYTIWNCHQQQQSRLDNVRRLNELHLLLVIEHRR